MAIVQYGLILHYNYCSVPGKRPWALKHTLLFWPAWALTRDKNSIRLYRSCYIDSLKCGAWAFTQKWALAQDTTVNCNSNFVHRNLHIQSH